MGARHEFYSEFTGKLIPTGTITEEEFNEAFGMSFKDFYNNIDKIQVINLERSWVTYMLQSDGKVQVIMENQEMRAVKFRVVDVSGNMKGLFQLETMLSNTPDNKISIYIKQRDDDDVTG